MEGPNRRLSHFRPGMRLRLLSSLAVPWLACAPPAPPSPPPVIIPATAVEVPRPPEPEPEPPAPIAEVTAAPPPNYPRPADWPEAVVFPAVFDPAHARITSGAAGDIRLAHAVERSDVATVGAEWTRALAARGFAPREPCTLAPEFACVFTDAARLVVVTAGPGWDNRWIRATAQWLPIGHTPIARLPGACVTPPQRRHDVIVHSAAITQDGEYVDGSNRWEMVTTAGADLDGDGRAETYVPRADTAAGTCPWDVAYDVYVMRGACGHHVGAIVGPIDEPTHTAGFQRGLRRIDTVATWASGHGLPLHHTRTRCYGFDGERLVLRSDHDRTGKCHHCGVAHCVAG